MSKLLTFALATCSLSVPLQAQPPDGPRRPSLRERAAHGDSEAQFNLAKMYEAGRGGLKQDYVEAEKWYRSSAEQGDVFAQASLGLLYRFGKGVPQDYVKAYQWFYLAASHAGEGERESIEELRDGTAAKMKPEQIEEAKRWASEWKPKPPIRQ